MLSWVTGSWEWDGIVQTYAAQLATQDNPSPFYMTDKVKENDFV